MADLIARSLAKKQEATLAITNRQLADLKSRLTDGGFKSGNISVFSNPSTAEVIVDAEKLKLNTITIPVKVHADTATSSTPYLDSTDWAFRKQTAIDLHTAGYKIIIEPFPFVALGTIGETEWNPSDMDLFFTNYTNILREIATFCELHSLEAMYISSNLVHMEAAVASWTSLVEQLRSLYQGKLIYRTNWWYKGDPSWDQAGNDAYWAKVNNPILGLVDIIGIAAYFEVSDKLSPTKEQLKADFLNTTVWNRGQNIYQETKAFHTKWDKPIFFGELGICPYAAAPSMPWSDSFDEATYDEQVQVNWFSAFYELFKEAPWYMGYSVFTINDATSHFRVIGRAAETTIKEQSFEKSKIILLEDSVRDLKEEWRTGVPVLNGTETFTGVYRTVREYKKIMYEKTATVTFSRSYLESPVVNINLVLDSPLDLPAGPQTIPVMMPIITMTKQMIEGYPRYTGCVINWVGETVPDQITDGYISLNAVCKVNV